MGTTSFGQGTINTGTGGCSGYIVDRGTLEALRVAAFHGDRYGAQGADAAIVEDEEAGGGAIGLPFGQQS
ncbi:hypothetical protein [Devosia sp. CN2-171]|uniref:hypothetical protein n=1 Tax=Devosia sp. CN2-171 TaxID=3400909 RepID=UPI003BF8B287